MSETDDLITKLLHRLTPMERRILQLISDNRTSREIADQLYISYRTVQNHRYNISKKLDLKGSNSLLEFAINHKAEIIALDPDNGNRSDELPYVKRKSLKKSKWIVLTGIPLIIIVIIFVFIEGRKWFSNSVNENPSGNKYNRIAVMPIRLIGADSSDLYLADGLTEDLINRFSQIEDLGVIARSSVMLYKGIDYPSRKIADELDVDAFLEGSIQRNDSLLRINIQVIDAETEESIWGGSYDRKLRDFLKIQREISIDVTGALNIELFLETLSGRDPGDRITEEAQLDYLKGRFFFNKNTRSGFEKALEYYTRAIRLQTEYARAWSGIADVYTWMSNFGFIPPDSAYPQAREAALKALELDPDLSEAYTSMGAVYLLYDWNFPEAEQVLNKATQLNPGDIIAHRLLALLSLSRGNNEEALYHTNVLIRYDPLSIMSNAVYGRTLYFTEKYDKAESQLFRTLELDPTSWLVNSYLGELYLETGENAKAIKYLEKAASLSPGNLNPYAKLAYGYARTGNKKAADEMLEELIHNTETDNSFSFQISLVFTALNDKDRAFEWMNKAFQHHHDFMLDLKSDPKLDPMRDDSRYQEFVEKMGLGGS